VTTLLIATDDGRDSTVGPAREAALRWARSVGARVILYDRAAESYFLDPYPSGTWTADVSSGPRREDLLAPDDLELLGRRYLADQVVFARRSGVDAYGWLPPRPGSAGMSEAVERFAVDLVVLPASMERPSLVDRVRGNTVERFRAALPVPVLVAGAGHEIATELAAAAR
jgi:hypothetical protein